jgi:hypothetical protein
VGTPFWVDPSEGLIARQMQQVAAATGGAHRPWRGGRVLPLAFCLFPSTVKRQKARFDPKPARQVMAQL